MSQLTIETFSQESDELIKLNNWIFDNIQPYIKGRTLEMDSGSGVFSSLFVQREIPIHLNDTAKSNRDQLRERFAGAPQLKSVNKIDFSAPDFESQYPSIIGAFSTVVRLNIGERGFYKQTELANAKKLLRRGGNLIMAIPSKTALFPGLSLAFQDLQRYDRKPIKRLFNEFQLLKTRYFSIREMTDTSMVVVVARKN